MKTYKYTDDTNTVVHIFDEDGVSRSSTFVSALPAGVEILPADPVGEVVPEEVTRFQARAALLQAGLLDEVESLVFAAGADRMLQLAYEAATFKRHSQFVQAMAQQLDLSERQLDGLFIAAAQIE